MCSGDCNQGRSCNCGVDNVKPFRGIINGLLISIPIWFVILLALVFFFK